MTDLSLSMREQIADKLLEISLAAADTPISGYELAGTQSDAILELLKGAVPVWQPIETAPKDGTWVILSDGADVYFGAWGAGDDVSKGFMWGIIDEDGDSNAWADGAPTHWMEPPLSPAASSQRWG